MTMLKNTLLVGSTCIPNLGRVPKDYDIITTEAEFRELIGRLSARNPVIEMRKTRNGRAALMKNMIIDAEIVEVSEFDSREALRIGLETSSHDFHFGTLGMRAASPDFLYTLKMSHRYLKNSPHFLKTMKDIWHLRLDCDAKIVDEEFYRAREKATYNYGHPKLKVTSKEFFTPDVPYVYDHDSIHRAVAIGDVPAYTLYLEDGEEVKTSNKKFESLPIEFRLRGVLEESYVLALERAVIPHNANPESAFKMALSKVCTSITSGKFREFAWENYYQVLKLYDADFVDKFNAALNAGKILPFRPREP